jgi:hypothetical protein
MRLAVSRLEGPSRNLVQPFTYVGPGVGEAVWAETFLGKPGLGT